jgi:membrane associated rhomboid family serine protease
MSEENKTATYNPPGNSSPIVKYLVITNVLIFAIQYALQYFSNIDLADWFALYNFGSEKFEIYQLVTHIFLHASFTHLFFNMFVLWMFGSALEQVWSPKKFMYYYFFTGIGAAFLHLGVNMYTNQQLASDIETYQTSPSYNAFVNLVDQEIGMDNLEENQESPFYNKINNFLTAWKKNPDSEEYIATSIRFTTIYEQMIIDRPSVGASGAVFGILLAFGMLFPNILIYVYFLFPIKAKYFVIIMGFIELYMGLSTHNSSVANFAHVGGMLFGYILMRIWGEASYRKIN